MSIIKRVLKRTPQVTIVEPHKKISREVKEKDLKRLKSDAQQMVILTGAMIMRKMAKEIFAIAHPQVENKDPLRFFTFCPQSPTIVKMIDEIDRSMVIINPRIVRHTKTKVDKDEGCVTFLGAPNASVERYNKIDVEYQQVNRDKATDKLTLTPFKHKSFSGIMAQIFQHEIDHFDGVYVYKSWDKKKK